MATQDEMQKAIKDACSHKRAQIKSAGLPAPTAVGSGDLLGTANNQKYE